MPIPVAGLIEKLRHSLTGEPAASEAVRRTLLAAQRSRARIELIPIAATRAQSVVLSSTIEQVLANGLVISRPLAGGVIHPLARFEHYRLLFVSEHGRLAGETRVLGRIHIPSGGENEFHGYRMEMPAKLNIIDRRRAARLHLGECEMRCARLIVVHRRGALNGVIDDISSTGARLSCVCEEGECFIPDAEVHISLHLRPPLGTIHEVAKVIAVEPDPEEPAQQTVRVMFKGRNLALEAALREWGAVKVKRSKGQKVESSEC